MSHLFMRSLTLLLTMGFSWGALAENGNSRLPGCWRLESQATSLCRTSQSGGEECIGLVWIMNLETNERILCNRLEVVNKSWNLRCGGSLRGPNPDEPVQYVLPVADLEGYDYDTMLCHSRR